MVVSKDFDRGDGKIPSVRSPGFVEASQPGQCFEVPKPMILADIQVHSKTVSVQTVMKTAEAMHLSTITNLQTEKDRSSSKAGRPSG